MTKNGENQGYPVLCEDFENEKKKGAEIQTPDFQ